VVWETLRDAMSRNGQSTAAQDDKPGVARIGTDGRSG